MLTGDEMFISPDGRSHTIYRLEGRSASTQGPFRDIVLEESYDIEHAMKKMSLICPTRVNGDRILPDDMGATTIRNQDALFSFQLQEINNGVQRGMGTGSMTWESSIAMSLYFTENPHELKGSVIELGSGVGLGGILSKVAKELSSDSDDVSVTCTDGNDEVLEMLEHNMDAAASSRGLFENDSIHIKKLDWFDFVGNEDKGQERSQQYDTIIASDCAYLPSQVRPLSETISQLLGKEGEQNQKLHMFAPVNRAVVYELTDELRDSKNMNVQVERIDLSKHRIKKTGESISKFPMESSEGSKGISRFLHITAWHAKNADQADSCGSGEKKSMIDID
eukprot:CCRYP_003791-RA/>CCRYP_003791-RA protein AED:0.15 eAED:0.15 QI:0/-1/0/1/-1/1/1/0/335